MNALTVLLLLACLCDEPAKSDEPAKGVHNELDGEWILVTEERRIGSSRSIFNPKDTQAVLTIHKGVAIYKRTTKGETYTNKYRLKLYPHQSPKGFDAIISKDIVMKGIYSLKDNKLIRYHSQPGKPRPKSFKITDGNIKIYSVWKRKQKTKK